MAAARICAGDFFAQIRWWILAGWLAFAALNVEDLWSYARLAYAPAKPLVRVVSLNCAGGQIAAAREVAEYRPDIVLLQETPSEKDVAIVARELFGKEGTYVSGPDGSILSRGKLIKLATPLRTINYTAADLMLDGRGLRVVSLRLAPPTLRFDLWNPGAWADYAENKRNRKQKVRELVQAFGGHGRIPDIAGGDFNTPPDNTILSPLEPHLKDSFAAAGRGRSATAVNPWPLVRIDQVWHSDKLIPVSTTSHNTINSDHCLVVADFRLSASR